MISLNIYELHTLCIVAYNMMADVSLHQTSPKVNMDENMWVVVHNTWELVAQKDNMLLLCEIHSLANSTLEIYALEVILMIGLSLIGWQYLLLLSFYI
jgi:hypothetical protein